MRKLLIALFMVLAGVLIGRSSRAQTATALTITGGAPHTTCLTPLAGAYYFCVATDGIWVSNSGAAYFQVVAPAAAAGVTSVTVCNAAGAACGTALSGSVTLDIPKTATTALQ